MDSGTVIYHNAMMSFILPFEVDCFLYIQAIFL